MVLDLRVGRQPTWVKELLAAGGNLEDYRVGGSVSKGAQKAVAKKTVGKAATEKTVKKEMVVAKVVAKDSSSKAKTGACQGSCRLIQAANG